MATKEETGQKRGWLRAQTSPIMRFQTNACKSWDRWSSGYDGSFTRTPSRSRVRSSRGPIFFARALRAPPRCVSRHRRVFSCPFSCFWDSPRTSLHATPRWLGVGTIPMTLRTDPFASSPVAKQGVLVITGLLPLVPRWRRSVLAMRRGRTGVASFGCRLWLPPSVEMWLTRMCSALAGVPGRHRQRGRLQVVVPPL